MLWMEKKLKVKNASIIDEKLENFNMKFKLLKRVFPFSHKTNIQKHFLSGFTNYRPF